MKNKSAIIRILAIILLIAIPFSLIACGEDKDTTPPVNDDGYILTLSGLIDNTGKALADINITKAQIKQLFAVKPVVHGSDNPVYASDKTDDYGNKIPHTVKGVYLEDILATYTNSDTIDVYGSMTLNADDGYVTVATEDIFNSAGRGSKMIIAIEYDGNVLNTAQSSGALRAVFPDQIANCWAKRLNKIEFATGNLQAPAVTTFTVLESITKDYGSFLGKTTMGGEEVECRYFGYSIAKLIEDKVLNALPSDKMHCIAWDYDDSTDKYSEYSVWTKYDVFSGGWLLFERQITGSAKEVLTRTPVFDGPEFSLGMTVKNILSLSVFNNSIVSMNTALTRFDTDNNNEFALKDLLLLLNMYDDENSYKVVSASGQELIITSEQINTAAVSKQGNSYVVNNGKSSITVATVSINQ